MRTMRRTALTCRRHVLLAVSNADSACIQGARAPLPDLAVDLNPHGVCIACCTCFQAACKWYHLQLHGLPDAVLYCTVHVGGVPNRVSSCVLCWDVSWRLPVVSGKSRRLFVPLGVCLVHRLVWCLQQPSLVNSWMCIACLDCNPMRTDDTATGWASLAAAAARHRCAALLLY